MQTYLNQCDNTQRDVKHAKTRNATNNTQTKKNEIARGMRKQAKNQERK